MVATMGPERPVPTSVTNEVEVKNETGNPVPTADASVVAAVQAASSAIVTAIQTASTSEQSALDAVVDELGDKLEPADITALATAANQATEITALGSLVTELAQKLEPGDLSGLSTAAHQSTIEGKLDSLLTELAQKLEATDVAALATAANQVTENGKLDSVLTELGQKLEPADLALLSTAAKQDAAKAVLDTMSTTLSNIAGYVDGLEAAEASNLAKLEAIRLLLAGSLGVVSALLTDKRYQQLTSTAAVATIASLCSGGALPAGAAKLKVRPSAPVRFRTAADPSATVGYPVFTNEEWTYDGDDLANLRVYGAATLDCWFLA